MRPYHPLLAVAGALLFASSASAERIQFNRDIRPIFSDTCYACHGPDENKVKGKLRLDSLDAARKGGKSGDPAITPGHPEKSEVMKRLLTTDADDHMPPAEFHKVLSKAQIALVEQWIKEGAEYQGHWAFQIPVKPAVPKIPAGGNAIDAFLAQGFAAKGLKPNGEAPKATLLRRAALDLTGLPPSDADLQAYLADSSPEAWPKALDRLMASPHYGEHMAAQWLDFARYADSNGFQSDTQRTMWPYRDWVIKAFNTNQPFDAFTVEQLAGDLLPNATRDQVVATAFHRNHRINGEGGRIVEEWFAENVIDRIETTGSTWMGLTMNCCRCHDHKYDPISQKEFYQFFAYFNSIEESGVLGDFGGAGGTKRGGNTPPVLSLPTKEQQQKIDEASSSLASSEQALKSHPDRPAGSLRCLASQTARRAFQGWRGMDAFGRRKGLGQGKRRIQTPRRRFLAGFRRDGRQGDLRDRSGSDGFHADRGTPRGPARRLPAEQEPRPRLQWQFRAQRFRGPPQDGRWQDDQYPAGQSGNRLRSSWLDDRQTRPCPMTKGKAKKTSSDKAGWAIAGNEAKNRVPRKAIFTVSPTPIPAGAKLIVVMRHEAVADHSIGRFRLNTSSVDAKLLSIKTDPAAETARRLLAKPADQLTPVDRKALAKLFADSPEHRAPKPSPSSPRPSWLMKPPSPSRSR
ncbi:hypothetical protein EMGBS6_17960 [Opitutia bacterium]|nr:hypothetical protein EMGBS6_17960 [Opitutae bacterium]